MSGASTPEFEPEVSQVPPGDTIASEVASYITECNICENVDDLLLSIINEEWALIQGLQKHTDGGRHKDTDALLQSLADKYVQLYEHSASNGRTGDLFYLHRALANLSHVVNIPPSDIAKIEMYSSKAADTDKLEHYQEEITNYHLRAIKQTKLINRKLWEATHEMKYLNAAIASAEFFLRASRNAESVECEVLGGYDVNEAPSTPPFETENDETGNDFDTNDRYCVLRSALIWLGDFFHPAGPGKSKDLTFTTRCTVAAHILVLTEDLELGSLVLPQIPTKSLLALSKSLNTFYRANPNHSVAERALKVGIAMCHQGQEYAKDGLDSEMLAANLSALTEFLRRREGKSSTYREGEYEIEHPASSLKAPSWSARRTAMKKFNDYRYFHDKSESGKHVVLVKPAEMDEITWETQREADRAAKRKQDRKKRGKLLKEAIAECQNALNYGRESLRRGKEEKPALGDWTRNLSDMARERIRYLAEKGRGDKFPKVKRILEEELSFMREEEIYRAYPDARPLLLAGLARVCESIYQHDPDNNTDYFDESIKRAKQVLDIVRLWAPSEAGTTPQSSARNTLSKLYLGAFERSGKPDDLQKAFNEMTKSLDSQNYKFLFCPYGHEDIKFRTLAELFGYLADLSTLAQILERRFSSTGNYPDILKAIEYQREVVKFCSPDRVLRAGYQVLLSQYLAFQYDHASGRLTDSEKDMVLREAINEANEAWEVLENSGDTDVKADCILALSSAYDLRYRFDRKKYHADHARATSQLEQSMKQLSDDLSNLNLARLSSKLSNILARSKDAKDQHQASKYAADALVYCPAQFTILRANLQLEFAKKILATPELEGLARGGLMALRPLKACFECTTAIPGTRLLAVVQSCKLLREAERWGELFTVASEAMGLFRLLPIQSLSARDQQKTLADYVGFAPMAAAAALEAGKPAADALRILEEGRDIIAGQRFDTRVNLSALRQVNEELANRFEQYRAQLDPSGIKGKPLSSGSRDVSGKLLKVNSNLQGVIREIRKLKGFEGFLLPPGVQEMKSAAGDGAIVVINVVSWRCDAFIVRKDPKLDIISIPLPKLSEKKINEYLSTEGKVVAARLDLLHYLWAAVAEPVLSKLDYNHDLPYEWPVEFYPRVWWCTTGTASRLPMHAATGESHQSTGGTCFVMNRVVSSYTSSIKALIFSRAQAAARKALAPEERGRTAVLCGVHETRVKEYDVDPTKKKVNFRSLNGPHIEIYRLKKIIKRAIQRVPEQFKLELNYIEEPKKEQIISGLAPQPGAPPSQYPAIFHFAGHAYSTAADPSRSCLIPVDKGLEVCELADINIHEKAPILAYLSACVTGVNLSGGDNSKNPGVTDEGIHLMGAMQMAGFVNVIGSLWAVNDSAALTVAEQVYTTWLGKGGLRLGGRFRWEEEGALARCLHNAVLTVRAQNKNIPQNWAPFIHMGV